MMRDVVQGIQNKMEKLEIYSNLTFDGPLVLMVDESVTPNLKVRVQILDH